MPSEGGILCQFSTIFTIKQSCASQWSRSVSASKIAILKASFSVNKNYTIYGLRLNNLSMEALFLSNIL